MQCKLQLPSSRTISSDAQKKVSLTEYCSAAERLHESYGRPEPAVVCMCPGINQLVQAALLLQQPWHDNMTRCAASM